MFLLHRPPTHFVSEISNLTSASYLFVTQLSSIRHGLQQKPSGHSHVLQTERELLILFVLLCNSSLVALLCSRTIFFVCVSSRSFSVNCCMQNKFFHSHDLSQQLIYLMFLVIKPKSMILILCTFLNPTSV